MILQVITPGMALPCHLWRMQPCADIDCRLHARGAQPPSISCVINNVDTYRVDLDNSLGIHALNGFTLPSVASVTSHCELGNSLGIHTSYVEWVYPTISDMRVTVRLGAVHYVRVLCCYHLCCGCAYRVKHCRTILLSFGNV